MLIVDGGCGAVKDDLRGIAPINEGAPPPTLEVKVCAFFLGMAIIMGAGAAGCDEEDIFDEDAVDFFGILHDPKSLFGLVGSILKI